MNLQRFFYFKGFLKAGYKTAPTSLKTTDASMAIFFADTDFLSFFLSKNYH